MDFLAILLLFPWFWPPHIRCTALNMADLASVQYSLRIAKDPVIEPPVQDFSETMSSMTMVNKDGQKYTCSLPKNSDLDPHSEKTLDKEEPDIDELLRPLESGPCIFLTKDWWTYEVCYKKDIKQYHVEGDVPVGDVILLGTHNPDHVGVLDLKNAYHPQWYSNGSRCDLTGQRRQTEVRFVCDEAASQVYVGEILEQQSCEYRVMVHTDKLCGVGRMRTASNTTPLPIVCHPVLGQDQMDKYKLYKEKSILAKQLRKKQRRHEQSLKLGKHMEPGQKVTKEAVGAGTGDGMMEVMGDKIVEKILGEVNSLLEASLGWHSKVTENSPNPTKKEAVQDSLRKGEAASLASIKELTGERNVLLDRISEAKKIVEDYTVQMLATENTLTSLKQNKAKLDMISVVEMKLKGMKETIGSLQVNIAKLESKAKTVTKTILLMEKKLGAVNSEDSEKESEKLLQISSDEPNSIKIVEDPLAYDQTETTTELSTVTIAADKDSGAEGSMENLGGNIKISVSKLSSDEEQEDEFDNIQADKIVGKLEDLIRDKLSKNGFSKSGKVVEVKLIATKLPDGGEGADDRQLSSMVMNMMTGNVEGYEAIDQARMDEANYGFSWNDELLTKLDKKVEMLEQSGADADLVDKMLEYAAQEDEDIQSFWDETGMNGKQDRDTMKANGFPQDGDHRAVADKIVNDIIKKGIRHSNSDTSSDSLPADPVHVSEEDSKSSGFDNIEEVADSLANLFGDMMAKLISEESTPESSDEDKGSTMEMLGNQNFDDAEIFLYVDEDIEELDGESLEFVFYTDEDIENMEDNSLDGRVKSNELEEEKYALKEEL